METKTDYGREQAEAQVASINDIQLLSACQELYRILREDEHYPPYNPKMKIAEQAIAKATESQDAAK